MSEEANSEQSYLEWDNDALGREVKECLNALHRRYKNGHEEKWLIFYTAAASLLVGSVIDTNAARGKFDFEDFSVNDDYKGSWEVIVRKKMPWYKRLLDSFINLFYKNEQLQITQHNDDDGKVQEVEVDWCNKKEA